MLEFISNSKNSTIKKIVTNIFMDSFIMTQMNKFMNTYIGIISDWFISE